MKQDGKGKGTKKYGRSKRDKDQAMSKFVKGKISAQQYFKLKGIKWTN